ncbi:MAG: hypothetical protein ACI9H6_000184 [Patiriisocius sp.]|jgi:hypothetical protein
MDNSLYTAKTLVQERAEILPKEILSLITEGELDVTMFAIENEFELTAKQVKLLENEIILVLLFFLKVEGFTQRVSESLEITILVAEKIASVVHTEIFSEMQDLFDLVDGPNPQVQAAIKKEELVDLEQTLTAKATPSTEQPGATAPVKLEEFTTVQSMRTMEGDMSRVHGYGAYRNKFPDEVGAKEEVEEIIRSASQEGILTERPKLTEKPGYGGDE